MNKSLLSLIIAVLIGSALVIKYQSTQISDAHQYQPREKKLDAKIHKPAAEYLSKLRSNWETGKEEIQDYYRAKQEVKNHRRLAKKSTPDLKWTEMGPDNIGGRLRGLIASKTSPKLLFAGSVSGGLFRSKDGGNNWKRMDGFNDNLVISALAETKKGIIYAGTGSIFERPSTVGRSGFHGAGVFRSSNGGESFELIDGTQPDKDDPTDKFSVWNEVKADPSSNDKVWLGGTAGLFSYSDGKLKPVTGNGLPSKVNILDISISEDGKNIIIANSGLSVVTTYLSEDGGKSWEKTSGKSEGKLPETSIQRIEYAHSPDDKNWVYASVIKANRLEGIYQSTDGGKKWNVIGKGGGSFDPFLIVALGHGQGVYDNAITVVPGNKRKIFVGGIYLFTWDQIVDNPPAGDWRQAAFTQGVPQRTVHSDIHVFTWGVNGEMYIGTDGGVYISKDIGETFYPANTGLNATQLYGITYSPKDLVIGGTQDNGTFYLNKLGATVKGGKSVLGGDGFDCEISQMDPNAFFVTLYFGLISRTSDNALNMDANVLSDRIKSKGNPGWGLGEFHTIIRLFEDEFDEDSKDYIQFVPDSTMFPGDTIHYNSRSFDRKFFKVLEDTLNVIDEIKILDKDSIILVDVILTKDSIEFDSIILTEDSLKIDTNIVDTVIIIGNDTLHPGDTLVSIDTVYNQGDTLLTNPDTVFHQGDTLQVEEVIFEAGDTIQINIVDTIGLVDPVQSILALGMNQKDGVWITRQALHFNGVPEWWQIMGTDRPLGFKGAVTCMEFSKDGDKLFIGTDNGTLWRISGLDSVYTKKDADITVTTTLTAKVKIEIISSAPSVITGISTFRDDPNILVYTVGGYGSNASANHVWLSKDATTSKPVFNAIDGNLPEMPVYEVEIDRKDSKLVIIGTEFGVWATDDEGKNWLQQGKDNVGNVPVFDVRQQWRKWNELGTVRNQGAVYIGTHGRGVWRSGTLVSVKEIPSNNDGDQVVNQLKIVPNPNNGIGYIEVNSKSRENGEIEIYSLNGTLIKTNKTLLQKGLNKVNLNASELPVGTYLVVIKTNGKIFNGKMNVVK